MGGRWLVVLAVFYVVLLIGVGIAILAGALLDGDTRWAVVAFGSAALALLLVGLMRLASRFVKPS
jgi:bacteriorhodopsin